MPPQKHNALRTVAALTALAKAAGENGDLADAERLLLEAATQASGFRDWDAILENATPLLPERVRRDLAQRACASAAAREEIWGFKSCALYYVRELGDRSAALATITDAERMLATRAREGRAAGFHYGFLATAFKEAVADDVAALRALEAGWAVAWEAHDAEDLGRLVNFWQKLVDRDAAVARMHRVEEAAREWGNLGGVIYWWWQALGDAEAGRRVRRAVLETSTSFEPVMDLVRHWHLYEEESPGVEEAYARAAVLAKTADDCFVLAHQAHLAKGLKGESEVLARQSLDRAAALAEGASPIKIIIANAYIDWFADQEAAHRLGPLGVRPQDLPRSRDAQRARDVQEAPGEREAPGEQEWPSSSSDLFDWLRARATPETLDHIARADYGDSSAQHLEALTRMCTSGLVPFELAWHPGEVVELTRWSTGEAVDHTARALCCTLLCLASRDDELVNTGPPLIESCLVLGRDAAECCERFLAWHHETTDADAPESLVSLVLLAILRAAQSPTDVRLPSLLHRIRESEHAPVLRELVAASLRADLWTVLCDRVGLSLTGGGGTVLANAPLA